MRAIRVLSVLCALAATSLCVNAQTINKVKVHLPYAVTVGSTELAPGDYEIMPATGTSAGKYFEIYSEDREAFAAMVSVMPTSKRTPARNTELTLHDNGNGEYSLDQLWIAGNVGGFDFSTAKSSGASVEVNANVGR